MNLKEKLRSLLHGDGRQQVRRTGFEPSLDQDISDERDQQVQNVEYEVERRYLQWYEADVARLRREYHVLKENYPDFELYPLGDGRIAWKGIYELRQNRYVIVIVYPYYYPFEPPRVYVLDPEIDDKELEYDGSILIFSIPGKEWNTTSTAKDVLDWAIEWLHFRHLKRGEERNG